MLSYAAFLQHPLATHAGVCQAVQGSMCVCVCVVFDSSALAQHYPFACFAFSMTLHGFFLHLCDSLYWLTLSLLWSLFVWFCVYSCYFVSFCFKFLVFFVCYCNAHLILSSFRGFFSLRYCMLHVESA